jgi:hypothetical protein
VFETVRAEPRNDLGPMESDPAGIHAGLAADEDYGVGKLGRGAYSLRATGGTI